MYFQIIYDWYFRILSLKGKLLLLKSYTHISRRGSGYLMGLDEVKPEIKANQPVCFC